MSRLQRGLNNGSGATTNGVSRTGGMGGGSARDGKGFEELKRLIHSKLVDKLDLSRVSDLAGDTLRREIRLVVERLCDTENPLLNRMERERLIDEVLDETFGFGPLEVLLKDPTISDILVNGPVKIYVERRGKLEKTEVKFRDNDHLMQIIDRIVTIEDAAELQLQQDHIVRLETRPPNIEGKGAVNTRDLVRNALRMRPERIIIGECRGAEALDMLQAMNTGHAGSMTTLHANAPRDAQARLETMIMMAGMELPIKTMRQQTSPAVDAIIQATAIQGGPRKVTSITEVMNMEQDMIIMQDIFRFKQLGIDQNGRAHGQFEATGVRPSFISRLEAAGIKLPSNLFVERVLLRD